MSIFLSWDMVLFNYLDRGGGMMGIGYLYIPQEKIIYGIAYNLHTGQGGFVELDFSNEEEINVNFQPFALLTDIPKYYEHQLVLITDKNARYFINYPSKNNLVIDSVQDLTSVIKPTPTTRIGVGDAYFKYENGVWQDGEGNPLVAVDDNVQEIN